jgi:hypothetical protein
MQPLIKLVRRMRQTSLDAEREADWVRTAHGANARAYLQGRLTEPGLSPKKKRFLRAVLRRL